MFSTSPESCKSAQFRRSAEICRSPGFVFSAKGHKKLAPGEAEGETRGKCPQRFADSPTQSTFRNSAVVKMADGGSEGIRGVVRFRQVLKFQKNTDHLLNLVFFSVTVSDDGLLY